MQKWSKKELTNCQSKFLDMDMAKTPEEFGKALEAVDQKSRDFHSQEKLQKEPMEGIPTSPNPKILIKEKLKKKWTQFFEYWEENKEFYFSNGKLKFPDLQFQFSDEDTFIDSFIVIKSKHDKSAPKPQAKKVKDDQLSSEEEFCFSDDEDKFKGESGFYNSSNNSSRIRSRRNTRKQ